MKRHQQQSKRRKKNEKKPLETASPTEESKSSAALSIPSLSSSQIVKILDHLVTFRTTVKNVSTSVQRIEDFVDSTYQLIEIANNFTSLPKAKKTLIQPTKDSKKINEPQKNTLPFSDDEIPVIELPKEKGESNVPALGQFLSKIDPTILFQFMNSPFIKKLITQFNSAEPEMQTSQYNSNQSQPYLYDRYDDHRYYNDFYYDPYDYYYDEY